MFRKVERLNDENDSLLHQIQTFKDKQKVFDKSIVEKDNVIRQKDEKIKQLSLKVENLDKNCGKILELEANIICYKETEKSLKEKTAKIENALKAETDKNKEIQETLNIERKLLADKNEQIKTMNEKLNDEVNKVMEDNDNKVKMELLNSEQQDCQIFLYKKAKSKIQHFLYLNIFLYS